MGPPITDLAGFLDPLNTNSRFLPDRIRLNSGLIVLCFVSVLVLNSQSAASYPTYLLALSMLVTVRHWDDVFRIGFVWVVVALLGLLALSALWSNPFEARDLVTAWTRAALVFLFVVSFAECQLRGEMERWLSRALAIVGIAAVCAALANFLTTHPEDGRLNGLGQLDTHVIAALVFGVVGVFALNLLMTEQSAVWKGLGSIGVILIAPAVALSDSRNAWVSVLIGASIFLLAQRFVAGIVSVGFVLGVAIAALAAGDDTRPLLLPRGTSFRPEIWSHTVERILAGGLWLGLGIGTSDDIELGDLVFQHPHNMYLSVAFQGGLAALWLLLLLIVWCLSILIRNFDKPDAKLALGILGIALPAYLLDGHELVDKVGSTWFLLWLPVAIALGREWSRPRKR